MGPELTAVEEDRWLVDRNRGGWVYATERLLANRLSEAKAEAWDEGYDAGARSEPDGYPGNPYRD